MNIPTTTPGILGRVLTAKAAIIRRLAAICALALTVFGLSVAAASAGTDESITTSRGSASFNDTKNLRIPERRTVNLKLCNVDNGVVTKCSRVQKATA